MLVFFFAIEFVHLCVCVCLSLSLYIYIYISLLLGCGGGSGGVGNRISNTKSRQRIVLKRFNNTTSSQVVTDSKLQFLWHFQIPSSWNVCRNCLSHHHHHHHHHYHHLSVLSVWQSAGGWWVNSERERERERERENTKLSKWSLVVTLLSWLEFGS